MKDARKNLRKALDNAIGEGRRFASARSMAHYAASMGIVDSQDAFSRNISRARSGDGDIQLGTIEAIAKTLGQSVGSLFAEKETSAVSSGSGSSEPSLKTAITLLQLFSELDPEQQQLTLEFIKSNVGGSESSWGDIAGNQT